MYYFIHIFELNLRLVGTEDVLDLGFDGQVLDRGLEDQGLGLGGQVPGLVTFGLDSRSDSHANNLTFIIMQLLQCKQKNTMTLKSQ